MHLLCRLQTHSRAGGGQGSLDPGDIVGNIASGGVGGGVLLAIVGTINNALGGGKGTPKAEASAQLKATIPNVSSPEWL